MGHFTRFKQSIRPTFQMAKIIFGIVLAVVLCKANATAKPIARRALKQESASMPSLQAERGLHWCCGQRRALKQESASMPSLQAERGLHWCCGQRRALKQES